MSVTVKIPSPLYRLTDGLSVVEAQGGTISDVLQDLEMRFPGLKDQVCDAEGAVRPSIHIFVNGEDIRFLSGLKTSLEDQARVSIIRAIAGGAS
jgi:molybdopterin synthase sulfur carrier subunit